MGAGMELPARQASFCAPSAGISRERPHNKVILSQHKTFASELGSIKPASSLLCPEAQQTAVTLGWPQARGNGSHTGVVRGRRRQAAVALSLLCDLP